VVAVNSAGFAFAASSQLGPIDVSPVVVGRALASAIVPRGSAARISSLLKHGSYTATFPAPCAGQVSLAWYYLPPGVHIGNRRAVLVAKGTGTATAQGSLRVKLQVTGAGRRRLRRRPLSLAGLAGFTPRGNRAFTTQISFSLQGA
jgi:hypothetical protein